jgi:hypothetical protein
MMYTLADMEKVMDTVIVFNLVLQPKLLAPSHNKPTDWIPDSLAQIT